MSAWKCGVAAWLAWVALRGGPALAGAEEAAGADEVVTFAVELDEFGIRPARLELPADRRVRITVTNAGRLTHRLHVDELGIGTDFVQPGGIEVIEFVPRRAGAYRMACAIDGHARVGRAGHLVVSGGEGVPTREVAADGDTRRPRAPAAR